MEGNEKMSKIYFRKA